MVNNFINNNYKELLNIARTAIFKSGYNYKPEELISLLYLHLLEQKNIKDLTRYSIRYIYQSCAWTNSQLAKDNRCKEYFLPCEYDVIEEEVIQHNDIDLSCLTKYELILYNLYYIEKKTVKLIISELKVKLTYSMVWRDIEKIRNKLKKQWSLLNSSG